jgi:hypothetical protein
MESYHAAIEDFLSDRLRDTDRTRLLRQEASRRYYHSNIAICRQKSREKAER